MTELSTWRVLMLVGCGGALGALARFGTGVGVGMILGKAWPFGTLAANLLGCAALGVMAGWDVHHDAVGPFWRALVMTGFLGAFTTYSTFSVETVRLLRESPSLTPGLLYIGVSLALGLLVAYGGFVAVE